MRIFKTDTKEVVLAKKAAMICQYSIYNPLHVFFEDGNFHTKDLDSERQWNDEYLDKNGQLMHDFVEQFINEWNLLTPKEKRECYILFRKKWDYLSNKWSRKLIKYSFPRPRGGICYEHYLKEDGHIYIKTDRGFELLQF